MDAAAKKSGSRPAWMPEPQEAAVRRLASRKRVAERAAFFAAERTAACGPRLTAAWRPGRGMDAEAHWWPWMACTPRRPAAWMPRRLKCGGGTERRGSERACVGANGRTLPAHSAARRCVARRHCTGTRPSGVGVRPAVTGTRGRDALRVLPACTSNAAARHRRAAGTASGQRSRSPPSVVDRSPSRPLPVSHSGEPPRRRRRAAAAAVAAGRTCSGRSKVRQRPRHRRQQRRRSVAEPP